jgi:photosystem II stability/assembly factor-like uncharacterized protein
MPLAHRSLLLDIAAVGERLVAVGERGHILVSDAPESGWQQAQVPTRQMLTAVHFADARRGWAVGHDGLVLVTSNGGMDWSRQYDGLALQASYNRGKLQRLNDRRIALEKSLAAAENPGERAGIMSALEELELDIEDAEYAIEAPLQTPPLLDIWFRDALHGYAVGAFGTLLVTDDGGVTWLRAGERLDNPQKMHLNGVAGDEQGGVWIAAETGLLFRSRDGGETWVSLDSPYEGTFFGIARAPDSGRLIAYGLRGNAFYSDDGGDSWRRSSTETDRSIAGGSWLNDRFVVLVGNVGSLLVSRDGGQSFTDRSLPSRLNLSAVAAQHGRLFAVGQGGVYQAGTVK